MESRVIVMGPPGCGKTAVMLRLAHEMAHAARSRRVFISFNFDDVLEVKHDLRAALDQLDNALDAQERQAEFPALFFGAGASFVEVAAPIDGSLVSEYSLCLPSVLRSALRELERLVRLVLARAKKLDHPETEFLVERQWFLFHGVHPPRLRLAAARALWPGRVCFSGMI